MAYLAVKLPSCIQAACMLGRFLGHGPFVEHVPLDVVQLLHHLGRAGVYRQLQAVAAWIAKVDRLEDGVLGGANHLNAVSFHARLSFHHLFHGAHFHRQVLGPSRGVAVAVHWQLGGQLKERQDVAGACIQKDVHVRVGFFGRWHFVFGNGEDKVHVQVFAIPLDGFFCVDAAVSDVVKFLDLHEGVSSLMRGVSGYKGGALCAHCRAYCVGRCALIKGALNLSFKRFLSMH